MKNRFISLIFVIAMVIVLIPAMTPAAFAETDVAEVNGKPCPTIEEAINEANPGDTVFLLTDVPMLPKINKAITIDGNNHKVAGADDNQFGTINGTVTLKNLVYTNGTEAIRTNYSTTDYSNLTLVIEKCVFNDVTKWAILGGSIDTGGEKTLKALTVTGCEFHVTSANSNYLIFAQSVQDLKVTGCVFNGGGFVKGAIHTGDSQSIATVADISGNRINGVARGIQVGNRVSGSSVTVSENTFTNITNAADPKAGAVYIHGNANVTATEVSVDSNNFDAASTVLYNDGKSTEQLAQILTFADDNKQNDTVITELKSAGSEVDVTVSMPVATMNDKSYSSLQKAINEATKTAGSYEIILASGTNAEKIIIHQTEGVNITIKGNKQDTIFSGYIEVYGHSRSDGEETLTFDGVVFSTSEKDHVFIEQTCTVSTTESNDKCYPHNITIQNCSFTATGDTLNTVVGMKFRYGYNIKVIGTTGTGLHTLMQNFSGQGLIIEDVTITDGKHGIALGTSQNILVREYTAEVAGYGLRVDAENETTITVEDSDIEAFIPVVVRNAKQDVDLVFGGANTMTATNTDGIWCAIGTSEYDTNGKMPSAPTGAINVKLNDTKLNANGVYGEQEIINSAAKIGSTYYDTLADAVSEAPTDGTLTTIELLRNVNEAGSYKIKEGHNVKVVGNHFTITAEDGFYVTGGELELGADLTVNVSTYYAIYMSRAGDVTTYANLSSSSPNYAPIQGSGDSTGNVTIKGGDIISTTPNMAIYWPGSGTLTIKGGTITGTTAIYFKSGALKITDGTIYGHGENVPYESMNSSARSTGEALVIENVGSDGYEAITSVSITGGTFISENADAVGSYTAGTAGVEAVTGFIIGGSYSDDHRVSYLAEGLFFTSYVDAELGKTMYRAGRIYTVTIAIPDGAAIVLKDADGNEIVAESDGTYKLPSGDYTYFVSQNGYQSKTGSFTVDGTDIEFTVSLDANTPDIPIVIPTYYNIIVNSSVNGNVTVNRTSAAFGTTVTLFVDPDDGYELSTLTVTDKHGNATILTAKSNGSYTFQMPNKDVWVTAVFTKEAETLDVPSDECHGDIHCPMYFYKDLDAALWYHDGVHFCLENALMGSTSASELLFEPNLPTSRAMIVTILWRLEGSPVVNYAMDFEDVAADQWYTEAIRWAASEKIVEGYGDTFGPDDPIAREQMAAILYRYAKYKGYDVSVGENTNILSYDDAFDVAEWAIPAMQWACGESLIQGIADGDAMNLEPQGHAARAQAATILYRFMENVAKEA